jgi:hypothetical protein
MFDEVEIQKNSEIFFSAFSDDGYFAILSKVILYCACALQRRLKISNSR